MFNQIYATICVISYDELKMTRLIMTSNIFH